MIKLKEFSGFRPKAAYNFGRILAKVQSAERDANQILGKLVSKYAKKDEQGKIFEPKGPGSFEVSDDNVGEYDKEFKELQEVEIEIRRYKLLLEEVDGAKLTPDEIMAIEKILVDPEAKDTPIDMKTGQPISPPLPAEVVAKANGQATPNP